MEDVAEEPVTDIDSCDKGNQLAVAEYIDDLYKFYKKAEVIKSFHFALRCVGFMIEADYHFCCSGI